ncbi:unnamed protein product [Didymodactylos carnosus]|uniref:Pentafunctional AROM polypeptide n=1 Tax=Didymodactylos carnosus TaxID=1234261 RepID=A0A814M567_9BILA|nr:unnamed protein product [Didymodactylos carnosus]CAF1074707.1 unnamed protein product [Didymodactylos carnosus]CAF1082035.1 unnamed protein product [Didymodactylos carnosus]CAF3841356.1 unnamed protein product [Didymodactylos carnosus]CAF3841372.1 unnamed protein product [Didymodactylos carnosus]
MDSNHSNNIIPVGTYNVHIGYDLLQLLPDYVFKLTPSSYKYVLITDENLFKLYGETIITSFKVKNVNILHYTIPPSESSKSREQKANIEDFMFDNNCNIDTVILALGGGVVGDLAGFVASTYMRGIGYIQIPTSLLAMIDSSIGGKTSINVEKYGKNLLGSFHRPKAVLIDIRFLETLSVRDLCNGMAEAIKMALICDEQLFTFIETSIDKILNKDTKVMIKLIYECVKLKVNIVIQDEKETSGLRSVLNFGHSIGHGIEILLNGKLLHGECVSIGMVLEAELARNKGFLMNSNIVMCRLNNMLKSFHLPTKLPSNLSIHDIVEKMAIDKKNRNGKKQLVILTNIGSVKSSPSYTTSIDDQDLINQLDTNVTLVADNMTSSAGTVYVPGSKSISNRVLILCALGIGVSRIHGLLYSIDTQTMLTCLRQLGVQYYWDKNEILIIHGTGGKLTLTDLSTLYLNNSGTCSRFLTTLCTILPDRTEIILTGDERLKERPIKDLVDTLTQNKNNIEYLNEHGHLPIKISSNGQFRGGEITINGDVSSQYVTSLLLMSPFASKSVVLKLNQAKQIVSKPYIDMTIELMKTQFSIAVDDSEPFSYTIPCTGPYQNPSEIQIEGDASSASYFLAIAAVHPGLTVTVANIGSNSLQGDSQFCRILEMMGCHVTQTETTTTLTGPEQLQAIADEIDMNKMTDTFMTLACVAVFAHGRTRIRNISNQRLKECNRIEAMVTELQKCGISASEVETGLDIEGINNHNIEQSAIIHCYDDHRIAMSFSIVSSRCKNISIDDKCCVDKTYPEFWLQLEKVFGFKVTSPMLILDETVLNTKKNSNIRIFLIGMPCSGKSTIGRFIANKLKYLFIDVDKEIDKEIHGSSIKDYINQNGWQIFRSLELKVFKQIVQKTLLCKEHVVVSCGGGCIETAEVRDELCKQPYVIYINRDLDDIKMDYLKCTSNDRPHLDLNEKLQERKVYYRQCSKYEFCLLKNEQNWRTNEINLLSFIKTIVAKKTQLPISENSFFICLTYKNLLNVDKDRFLSVIHGCDAIELRVDLLESYDIDFIGQQLAYIRKHTHLPIIYTVRSQMNYGTFNNNEVEIFQLLNYGIKFGCEFIDMEANWSKDIKNNWLKTIKNKHSYVIGSLHLKWSVFDFNQLIDKCTHNGQVDIIKIVIDTDNSNSTTDDMLDIFTQLKKSQKQPDEPKRIVFLMGNRGKLTRVLNTFMTPVTHELIPRPAAKGQLTVKQIQDIRHTLGLIESKQFYLFGSPIQRSLSPCIHQTGFDYFYLPYNYERCETNDVTVVQNIMKQSNFGGASVTVPLKQDVYKLFISDTNYSVSDSVKKIGAVNTITKLENGGFYGDNTDWIAIHKLITETLFTKSSVLVIGAGGTARAVLYALEQIEYIQFIYLYNPRTPENAIRLASTYNNQNILPVTKDDINNLKNVCIVINTLPSSINFTLDNLFFEQHSSSAEHRSVLYDVNYIPYETALTKQAKQYNWTIIYGIDMLIEQGLEQFQIWTGKATTVAPIIRQTVLKAYHEVIDHNE